MEKPDSAIDKPVDTQDNNDMPIAYKSLRDSTADEKEPAVTASQQHHKPDRFARRASKRLSAAVTSTALSIEQCLHHTDASDQNGRTIIFNLAPQPVKYSGNRISTAKYNVFSFLPKFLFEQFRRYANIFFLIVALFQQIPDVSPTGRFTTAVPLCIILFISALKEIVEDWKRHRADDATNNSATLVFRGGTFQEIKWTEVVVGDILKVLNGQPLPADLIILSSSEPQGMCYIETSNLDGETNLKIRKSLVQTSEFLTTTDLAQIQGRLECEHPNRHLYEFVGNLRFLNKMALPLGPEQLLLRGATIKNTKWIFGVVVYTGHETKVMLNSTSAPLKRSTVEKQTNTYILVLFCVLLFLTLFTSIAHIIFTNNTIDGMWYIGFTSYPFATFLEILKELMLHFILYHNLVPISLSVTLEMCRFIQMFYINWDLDMYYAETDTPAVARTSNLNEELGQVKYIFSDKTGTLTRNIMEFKKCSIAGVVYSGVYDDMLLDQQQSDSNSSNNEIGLRTAISKKDAQVDAFLTLMAVCHTVVPEQPGPNDDPKAEITYQASSPDESALVKAARDLGYAFVARDPKGVTISVNGVEKFYEILNVIEFTSTRKRMSVIVRTPEKRLLLMTKGADSVIYDRLAANCMYKEETLLHLEDFARIGLRTLCLASSEINADFYKQWSEDFNVAATSIMDREAKIEVVAERIEKNLQLLGASAIEDKLQDGVPDTISNLAKANIKIWVLTGDKQETAINIGYSCKLITQDMQHLLLTSNTLDTTRQLLAERAEEFGDRLQKPNAVCLIIEGHTLKYALTCDCKSDFLNIALSCKAVICCRVSPLQKAEIVQLVRDAIPDTVTLAIGDGANDVGMIQAAHVGVGISGVEGLQAACSSDYAIGQFRYLSKLLLVHGAWNYHRLTKLILYSFYKNVCLYVMQFWFAMVSGFSGQIIFERWTIGFYNVFFTAAPPLALGLFDRTFAMEHYLEYPGLYKRNQECCSFNVRLFLLWIGNSIVHSAVIFWLTIFFTWNDINLTDAKTGSIMFTGNMIYTFVVFTVCLKAGLEHTAWTWLSHLAIWGSIAAWFIFLIIYTHIWPFLGLAADMAGMDIRLFSCPTFWLGIILVPMTALCQDFIWKTWTKTFHDVQLLETVSVDKDENITIETRGAKKKKKLTETAKLLKNVFTRSRSRPALNSTISQDRGFAFSQIEGGAMAQSEVIRAYDTRTSKPEGH